MTLWKGTSTHDQQSRETEGTIRNGELSHNQVYETEGTAWRTEPSHSISHETEGTAWSAEPSHVTGMPEVEPFWEMDFQIEEVPITDR